MDLCDPHHRTKWPNTDANFLTLDIYVLKKYLIATNCIVERYILGNSQSQLPIGRILHSLKTITSLSFRDMHFMVNNFQNYILYQSNSEVVKPCYPCYEMRLTIFKI